MATFTVTTLADSIDATDGKLSLREALAKADARAGADTIAFASALEGKTLALTRGELAVNSDVTILGDPDRDGRGITIDQRTDDAQQGSLGEYGARVLSIDGDRVTLSGLTITGGSYYGDGGGIWFEGGSLRLERCAVVGNGTWAYDNTTYGGAIRVYGGGLEVVSSTIADNGASGGDMDGYGGAIATGAINGYGGTASVSITDSTITGNGADVSGGILIGDKATLGLTNSIVLGNVSTSRGTEYRPSDVDGVVTASSGHNVLGVLSAGDPFGDLIGVDPAKVFASTYEWGGGRLVLVNGTWVAPLLDAADNPALAAADPSTAGSIDQRGVARPAPGGTAPDVGAFELAQASRVSTVPSPGDDRIVGTARADSIDALAGNDEVRGVGGDDTLWGRSGNDSLSGGTGGDRLYGGDGTDTLDGGLGDDRLDGGDGIDTATYADAAAGVTVSLALAGVQATGGAGRDTLAAIENLVGSRFDDRLTGDGRANLLTGSDGDDTLKGGAGSDVVRGGEGDDTLAGGAGNDTLDGGEGFDTASYAGATGAVQVRLDAGTASGADGSDFLFSIEHVIGSGYADSLTGDRYGSVLDGGAGDDVLRGAAGDDWLDGGAGDDRLDGGANNEVYGYAGGDTASYTDATASVRVSLAVTGAQETGGAGRDTLVGIECLEGSAFGDTLLGNASSNVLTGAGGNDTLSGGGGDDALNAGEGDDTLAGGGGDDTLDGEEGDDTVSYAAAKGGVSVDLGNGVATGADGADQISGCQNVIGSSFADVLRGWGGAGDYPNLLQGGAGDDVLYGDTGSDGYDWDADTLTGGAGRDRFAYDWWEQSTADARDTITDFQGVGAAAGDRIDLAEVYAGALTFRGTAAFTGVGQVRVTGTDDATLIRVNLTGGTAPEMAILVQDGAATPGHWTAGDFIL